MLLPKTRSLASRIAAAVAAAALAVPALVCLSLVSPPAGGSATASDEDRAGATRDLRQGNFADAYRVFRALATDPDTDAAVVAEDLRHAVECLGRLNRIDEVDDLLESAVAAHGENVALLREAARQYRTLPHYGYRVAGEFSRGPRRAGGAGGTYASVAERDRVRALGLLLRARDRLEPLDAEERGALHLELADAVRAPETISPFELQHLTDLAELPPVEEGYGGRPYTGAPVTDEGDPVFHALPASFEAARSDGERWRFALEAAAVADPDRRASVDWTRASFLHDQFGVQTLAHFAILRAQPEREGIFALPGLEEDETIARLATGPHRFRLPPEHDFLRLFRKVADEAPEDLAERATGKLASIFENRMQYRRAAEIWRESLRRFGDSREETKAARIEQIAGNWGTFEPVLTQPARVGASVELRYRNARAVRFVARRVDAERLLDDVKDYLESRPRRLDRERLQIENLGWRIIHENEKRYVGETVAEWSLELSPRPKHFDRRITVPTPLREAGAYLLEAHLQDGNASRMVLFVADTTIVRTNVDGGHHYFVADAVTGAPVTGANLELFGYRTQRRGKRDVSIDLRNFAEKTGAGGQVTVALSGDERNFQWLVRARGEGGRHAYLGFDHVWTRPYDRNRYERQVLFTITDRPVYRPGQTVRFKSWVARARYDVDAGVSPFAGRSFAVEIHDARGEKVHETRLTADDYGGFDGTFELAAGAALGVYRIVVPQLGSRTFRVEEYKKPEFEVTVEAPGEPVALGDTVRATIRARYYFGAPVTEARVRYKVYRSRRVEPWYPVCGWDWLYGRGYCWLAYDAPWYPGFDRWGHERPVGRWWGLHPEPPELVMENEVEIGPDGTVAVEIDTEIARAIYGEDQDHRYRIEAEVTDLSRRTIHGSGSVNVTEEPFEVIAWVDRGFYRVGDPILARFDAHTVDGRPVEGSGELRVLRVRYDDEGHPQETPVERFDLPTGAQGRASIQLTAAQPGHYRLAYAVTDARGRTVEGGYLFQVVGEGYDGSGFRYNVIEVIPDRAEYAPGDEARLLVNTDRAGSTVLLFLRPVGGVYLEPQVLRLSGKSRELEVPVTTADMPNFFVEAVTVAGARLHRTVVEIRVPPEERVLDLTVETDEESYGPGDPAQIHVRLEDPDGEPFVGSVALTVYDRAVEYISGGSNVPDIRAAFWEWRRSHRPAHETDLDRWARPVLREDEEGMEDLGVFGGTTDEVFLDGATRSSAGKRSAGIRFRDGLGVVEELESAASPMAAGAEDGGDAAPVRPDVRREFADTALFVASVTTGRDGTASFSLDMPENLTTWKIRAFGMGRGVRVGEGTREVVTTKDVLLRLQAPRFFVERDEVVLSANIHNALGRDLPVRAVLELEGGTLEPIDAPAASVVIGAGREERVDWRVRAVREGEAVVRMLALSDVESDAMEMRFPVHVHGMERTESYSASIFEREEETSLRFVVPEERRPEATRLEVRWSPSLALAMVDALPYLADYPYGCTEQTLNRFLPAVIVQKVLLDLGIDLADVRDKRTNLNAQELGDPAERARQWKRFEHNPVFDGSEVRAMVKQGVEDLTEMQNEDGGWGWFSGVHERSFPHTTAIVVRGLLVARRNDVAIVPGVIERGLDWLERYREEQLTRLREPEGTGNPRKSRADELDALVFSVLVDGGRTSRPMLDHLHRDRPELTPYGKALFGLALHALGEEEKLGLVLENLEQFLEQDAENQTAWLRAAGSWWRWYGSETETNASYLMLLARARPASPVAPRIAKYLVNHRKHGTYWSSTRDTALVVEALAAYVRQSGEAEPDMTVEISVDGEPRKEVAVDASNLFTFDGRFVLEGDPLAPGEHTVTVRRTGKGPVYLNAYLTTFTLEDPIPPAGLEVRVERRVHRLIPEAGTDRVAGGRGQVVERRVEAYRRERLDDLATLQSGEVVEVELILESKNDYEYLVFEDRKAAGFEPVEVRSGYRGDSLGAYMELRDDRVSFLLRQLPRGRHSISYRLRAEIPGRFSALPALGYGMYAPELRGNSAEIDLRIVDRKTR